MKITPRWTRCLTAATVLMSATTIAVSGPAPFASAEESGSRTIEHCLLNVNGQLPTGEYTTDPIECFETHDEVLFEIHGGAAARAVIGTHYDGLNKTGSTLTVNGVNCLGGYVNLTPTWVNRVSSTANGCPIVRHYNGANLTGSSQSTTPSSFNLSTLNNLADSIQYTT